MTSRLLVVLVAACLWAAACTSGDADAPGGETATPTTAQVPDGEQLGGSAGGETDAEPASSDGADDGTQGDAVLDDDAPDSDASADDLEDAADGDGAEGAAGDDGVGVGVAGGTQPAALTRFSECSDVLDYVHANAASVVGPWGLDGDFDLGGDVFEEGAIAVDDAASGDSGSLQAGVDYSTSNVQETGIDEPDMLKTDGRRIVVATQNSVQIVDVTGPEPRLVATIGLGEHWVSNLLLHGDRVLVFALQWGVIVPFDDSGGDDAAGVTEPETGWGPTTEIVEIDLAGPTPSVVRRLNIEGNYVSARMTDGVVRIVTSSRPRAIGWAVPEAAGVAAEEQATEANREIAASTTVDHWLPRYTLTDAASTTLAFGRLVDCDRIWAPAHYSGPGTLSVTTIDITADGLGGSIDTTSILSDGSTVYASPQHLYVTTTRWFDWHTQPEGPDDGTLAETEIHMFDVGDAISSPYVGSASVTGTVLNQYSMSEHEGHLRIATTTVPPWRFEGEPDSESLVTVLAAGVDGLSVVGQIGGLGIGERIFAVRYLGDIAAVVTFRQTDPLYIIDLADPASPTVRGELKIHGYSAYLHPVGAELLLGLGQDADEEGRTLGTQASLFDISDLDRPGRIDQWTAPGGHSEVEFNALAFLYWPAEHLAVLPMVQYPTGEQDSEPPFIGAVALGIDGRHLTERARISFANSPIKRCRESREIIIRPDGTEERGELERYCWFDFEWEAQILASAVIGDRLYTASHKGLGAVDLASLERVSLLLWAD